MHSIFAGKSELSHKGILTSAFGAFVAIICVTFISRYFVAEQDQLILVASMGASSIILFAVSTSPMAKPWSLVGGTLIPATIGVFCYQTFPNTIVAVSVAIGLSIILMFYLRCLHPPGGAAALLAIVGGDEVHSLGYQFVLMPVAVNVFCILIIFLIYLWILDQIKLHKRKPRPEEWWELPSNKKPNERSSITDEDLNYAMQSLDEYIDINNDDLVKLISLTLAHADERKLSDRTCGEMLTNENVFVDFATELEEVWTILRQNKISSVAVVDRVKYVIGIISRSDFISHAEELGKNSSNKTLDEKELLRLLVTRTAGNESKKPEAAGQIMTKQVVTLKENDKLSDAIILFRQHQMHAIPILDSNKKYMGMLQYTHLL